MRNCNTLLPLNEHTRTEDLFIHSSVDGCLGCFQSFAVMHGYVLHGLCVRFLASTCSCLPGFCTQDRRAGAPLPCQYWVIQLFRLCSLVFLKTVLGLTITLVRMRCRMFMGCRCVLLSAVPIQFLCPLSLGCCHFLLVHRSFIWFEY